MSSIIGIALSLFVMFFPAIVTVFLFYFQDQLYTPRILRFESLFNNIRADSTAALLFTPFFLLRRLLVVMAAVFMPIKSGYHVQVFTALSVFMISYLILAKPFNSKLLNILEVFNEGVVLTSAYFLIFFSDYITDTDFKFELGFAFIVILCLCILTNWTILFIKIVTPVLQKIKSKCPKKNAQ